MLGGPPTLRPLHLISTPALHSHTYLTPTPWPTPHPTLGSFRRCCLVAITQQLSFGTRRETCLPHGQPAQWLDHPTAVHSLHVCFLTTVHKLHNLDHHLGCALRISLSLAHLQVTFGRDYSTAELQHMKDLFATWATGLVAWPPLQLPFLRYGKAMAARDALMKCFQAAVDETRGQLASGNDVQGVLASMIKAVDDRGNR